MQCCRYLGMTRQAYYKQCNQESLRIKKDQAILKQVQAQCMFHPRITMFSVIRAYKQALTQLKSKSGVLTHHSYRGVQYCAEKISNDTQKMIWNVP